MKAIVNNEELAEVLMRNRRSSETGVSVTSLHTLLDPYIHPESGRFSKYPVLLMLPENDRWIGANLSRILYDRLNYSRDMKLLKRAGHPPIGKEGLMHLEQYYMEFLEECLTRRLVGNCQ